MGSPDIEVSPDFDLSRYFESLTSLFASPNFA
jgi:hypothetical protein